MGIKNFMKLIQKYNAIKLTNISDYKNKTLGIDANLLIYKIVNAIRQNGYDIKHNNIIVTHIHTLLLKLIGFIKYNITPIFVFDGLAPQIKNETLHKRNIMYNNKQQKYNNATTNEDKKKYYMRFHITEQEMDDCKTLISIFNFTIIEAIQEADSQLVQLLKCNKIDYIVSDDIDILIFGGDNILKNFSVSSKKQIQEINLNQLKINASLTQEMIIDIAILIGCDYCNKAKNIGPSKAYKLITKYKNIETVAKHIDLNTDYIATKQYFLNPITINCNEIEINKPTKWNKQQLKDFLNKFQFDNDYYEKILKLINI